MLKEEILKVYESTLSPKVLTLRPADDPDASDALWFKGRHWRDINLEDWNRHSGAFTAFDRAAFRYYFPSVLCCALESPSVWLSPVDVLLGVLDRSPVQDNWDEFLLDRLGGWSTSEYELLARWLLYLVDHHDGLWGDQLERSFDTVQMLAKAAQP